MIRKTSLSKLWYKHGTNFKTPKAYVYLSFHCPESNKTVEAEILTYIFTWLFADEMTEYGKRAIPGWAVLFLHWKLIRMSFLETDVHICFTHLILLNKMSHVRCLFCSSTLYYVVVDNVVPYLYMQPITLVWLDYITVSPTVKMD